MNVWKLIYWFINIQHEFVFDVVIERYLIISIVRPSTRFFRRNSLRTAIKVLYETIHFHCNDRSYFNTRCRNVVDWQTMSKDNNTRFGFEHSAQRYKVYKLPDIVFGNYVWIVITIQNAGCSEKRPDWKFTSKTEGTMAVGF